MTASKCAARWKRKKSGATYEGEGQLASHRHLSAVTHHPSACTHEDVFLDHVQQLRAELSRNHFPEPVALLHQPGTRRQVPAAFRSGSSMTGWPSPRCKDCEWCPTGMHGVAAGERGGSAPKL